MGCSTLDTSTGSWDETFDSGRVVTTSEFLLLRLLTGNDRNGEEVGIYFTVEGEDVEDFLVGFGFVEECSVALLPEELSGPKEGFCGESSQLIYTLFCLTDEGFWTPIGRQSSIDSVSMANLDDSWSI
jgi:hypothetical protein